MINQALILVGGKGSRLGKITKKIPKPLLKINKKPFLDYIIKFLLKFKIKKIILLTKFKYQKFNKIYDGKKFGKAKIKCIREKEYCSCHFIFFGLFIEFKYFRISQASIEFFLLCPFILLL